MTGTHISDEQARIYRMFRELQTRKQAAQLASIGFSSAARIDNGSWTSPTNRVRGPRRKKLCGIWETAAAALLEQNPGASPKDLLHHLLERLPLFVTSAQRRTIERWIREWRVRHNHQKDISATFFHSAHQGYLGLGALNEQARNSPDLQLLLRCAKFAPLKKRNKAIMALAVLNRIPLMAAARYLKISPTTAKRWTNIFQEGGADALFHTKTVKPAKYVSKPLLSALFRVLHSPPSCYGFARTNWRAIDLKVAMETEGVTTSLWTIRRSLRQAGYRWRKAKVTLTSNDPLYRQKVDSIKSILTNLTSHEAFFSVDEYGPFSIKVQTGRRLVAPNEVLTVPQWQRNKGTLIITAALELATNQVSHFYSPRKNTNEMIVMIERLRRTYADKDILFISWDCASWHMSRTLEEKVEFLNGWAEHDRAPRLELVPLPSRAQFLNIIESIFSGMARAVIHNSDFKDVDAAKEMIDKYFAQRNAYYTRNPQRAGATIWGKERCVAVFNESENYKDPQYR